MKKNYFLTMMVIVLVSMGSYAQLGTTTFNIAADNAGNYGGANPSWADGSNQGTGFGTWTFVENDAGGGDAGLYHGFSGQGNPSFALYATFGGSFASATRSFTNDLKMGETISADIGHSSSIPSGGEVFLQLLDDGAVVFTLKFVGGDMNWKINDGGSDFGIAQSFAHETSLSFSFTYNEDGTYSYTFGATSGNNFTAANAISGINAIRFQTTNQGGGQNFGANNLAITSKYTIPNGSTVATGADITVPYLTVENGGTVNIGATHGVLVSGNLNVGATGTLNAASGSSLRVSGTSTGNVTYNRELSFTAGNLEGWHLVSAPVAGQVFNDAYITANDIANNGTNRGIATYNNAVASNNWVYHQGGASSTFATGTGYSVKRGTSTGNISFTGTVNTSDINSAITVGAGTAFNLIGNPYTAYINSGLLLPTNTALLDSQTIWIWNPTTKNYDAKVTGDAFKVAPGQGFFVKAASNGNFAIAKSTQSHETDTFLKSSKSEIALNITDGNLVRYAKVNYNDNASLGFDNGYDGETFSGVPNNLDIYTQLLSNNQNKNYQIQALPGSDFESMVIPVGIKAEAGKEITFTAAALNLPTGIKVFLEDRANNTFTRLDDNSNYKVTLDTAVNGIGRFYLHTKTAALSTSHVNIENVSFYTTNKSTLRITGLSQGKATLKLFNTLGKRVLNTSFTSNGVYEVHLPKLSTGLYIIQLENENGKLNKKIILE